MPANTISTRIAEFLSKFPPFDLATANELESLAAQVSIQYREAGENIFSEGQKPNAVFYVVRQGSVKIFQENGQALIDICDEGDIFGVRPLLANEPYLASAETLEECLLYAIPVGIGKQIVEQNPKVALFFAMGYASGKPMQRFHQKGGVPPKHLQQEQDALPLLSETVTINGNKDVLTCARDTTVQAAANAMTARGVGSILVVENGNPIGIVTDKDLRQKVATGKTTISAPISALMSSPVICIKPDQSVAEYMIEMVSRHVHHLCITEDGTQNTKVLGIISDHDLLLEQGYNPAIIIKEMRRTQEITVLLTLRSKGDDLLSKYLQQGVSMNYVSRMMAGLNNTLLQRIIEMTIEKVGQPPCAFAWLALGSQGREEQLLRTDQDHALVFEDGVDAAENETRKVYFLALANQVSQILARFGFVQDVADIGANHEKWCQPLSGWLKYFTHWVRQPDENNILLSTIFFDFRVAYGDNNLGVAMSKHLYEQLDKTQIFLPLLAKNALKNPAPLSFFRNFVVESSGEHKDEFDLKLRAMLPLVDAARVLVLQHKLTGINNTTARFKKLATMEPNNRELMEEAAEGYAILMDIRARFGLRDHDSGRFITPDDLNKLERQTLRNIFTTITDLQRILKVRFQTGYLG